MEKFSKGEWENLGEDNIDDVKYIRIFAPYGTEGGSTEVATASSFYNEKKDIFEITEEVEANAHLITAAPTLYYALQKLIEVAMNFDEDNQRSRMELRRALTTGNMALKKALGKK